jgi:DNA-binding HxlR family transcriptional regulator
VSVSRRRYDDGCGIAHALNLVGERWALLIVRDLLLGPKRFSDLQAGLPTAAANMLTQRLRDLESTGVVRRRTLPPPAGSQVYELTEWGVELGPILVQLGGWGMRSPIVQRSGDVGADSIMLGLRSSFSPQTRSPWTASYEIRIGRDRFSVQVVGGESITVTRGNSPGTPDAVIETDAATLEQIFSKQLTIGNAIQDDRLTVTGDVKAGKRLLEAVSMQ